MKRETVEVMFWGACCLGIIALAVNVVFPFF